MGSFDNMAVLMKGMKMSTCSTVQQCSSDWNLFSTFSRVPTEGSSGPDVDLSHGITSEVLQPLLENEEFVRKMKDLLPAVPGEDPTEDAASEIKSTVQSPQVGLHGRCYPRLLRSQAPGDDY